MLPAIRNASALAPRTNAPLNRLTPVFERLFDDFFAPLPTAAWLSLPLSFWEDENYVYVEMDAPGVKEEDIEVSVHGGDLIVRGERKGERKGNGYDSRRYGRFEQRFSLPTLVDTDNVEATIANGVLSVTFPKSEAAKPRKIALKTE